MDDYDFLVPISVRWTDEEQCDEFLLVKFHTPLSPLLNFILQAATPSVEPTSPTRNPVVPRIYSSVNMTRKALAVSLVSEKTAPVHFPLVFHQFLNDVV